VGVPWRRGEDCFRGYCGVGIIVKAPVRHFVFRSKGGEDKGK